MLDHIIEIIILLYTIQFKKTKVKKTKIRFLKGIL